MALYPPMRRDCSRSPRVQVPVTPRFAAVRVCSSCPPPGLSAGGPIHPPLLFPRRNAAVDIAVGMMGVGTTSISDMRGTRLLPCDYDTRRIHGCQDVRQRVGPPRRAGQCACAGHEPGRGSRWPLLDSNQGTPQGLPGRRRFDGLPGDRVPRVRRPPIGS